VPQKASVIVILEYLHEAFDIRESRKAALLCYLRYEHSRSVLVVLDKNVCNLSHKRRRQKKRSTQDFIGNTQNGSPFVIRDVFMCFRLENQSLLPFFLSSPLRFEKSQRRRRVENVFLSSASSVLFFLSPASSFSLLFSFAPELKSLMTLESLQWNVYSTRTTIGCWSNDVEQCNYFFNSLRDGERCCEALLADKSVDDEWEFI
jgi:hypothetical protein